MADFSEYESDSSGLAALFLNFVKVTILLAFVYMLAAETYMAITRIGSMQALLLDITEQTTTSTDGKFKISFFAAPLLDHFDKIVVTVKPADKFTEPTQSFESQPHGGRYEFICQLTDTTPGVHHFTFNICLMKGISCMGESQQKTLEVNYTGGRVPRRYDMYIVQDQWNFLPQELQNTGAELVMGGRRIPLNDKIDWSLTDMHSLGVRDFSGRLTRENNYPFVLRIFGVLNRPPASFVGEPIGLVYITDFPFYKGHQSTDQDRYVLLNNYIFNPDGIEPGHQSEAIGTRHVFAPKPNYHTYEIEEQVNDYEIFVNKDVNKNPWPQTPPCPYHVVHDGKFFFLARKATSPIPLRDNGISLDDARRPDTYESFSIHVKEVKPETGAKDIKIEVRFLREQ